MADEKIITLLTDFGTDDPYVAAMKGAILCNCPRARIVDLSHSIDPHDIRAAAFFLAQASVCFPPGTLHVVVIDPGVGTGRDILAGRFGEQRYLFPDNGVITLVAQNNRAGEIVAVDCSSLTSTGHVSRTFHGRDIFAPVAAELLNGRPVRELGPKVDTYKLLDIPQPVIERAGITGRIIHVDRFGNLISNIPRKLLRRYGPNIESLQVMYAGHRVGPVKATYGCVSPGEPLALINSMELLELAVNRGRAQDFFAASTEAEVLVYKGAMK